MKWTMLACSHGLAIALGWVLFFKVPIPARADEGGGQDSELAATDRPRPAPMPADPKSENAILRASSADFRALWREMHLTGRHRGSNGPGGISVFMDWCARDPEAAIIALKDTFAPSYSHNYLNNAVREQGVHLA